MNEHFYLLSFYDDRYFDGHMIVASPDNNELFQEKAINACTEKLSQQVYQGNYPMWACLESIEEINRGEYRAIARIGQSFGIASAFNEDIMDALGLTILGSML